MNADEKHKKKSFFNTVRHERENSKDKVLIVKDKIEEYLDSKNKIMRKIIINDKQEVNYSTNIIVTAKYNL